MVVCETLPLCPDTELDASGDVLTEPVEVGPYERGILFVKVRDSDGATVRADAGVSPSGYEDWDEHWVALDSLSADGDGMHALRLSNFGNWLRLRLRLEAGDGATALAWFVGKG